MPGAGTSTSTTTKDEDDIEPALEKVEHYEIATYGCLRTWAELLGKDEAIDLLEETLNEEKDVDESLTDIATNINREANEAEGEEEKESPRRGRPS